MEGRAGPSLPGEKTHLITTAQTVVLCGEVELATVSAVVEATMEAALAWAVEAEGPRTLLLTALSL